LAWQVLDDAEHELHPAFTVGPTSVPQVLPPLLPPLLLPAVPPLLLPLLPLLPPDPPELLPPAAQTPLRGTQPLTCAPSTELRVVQASLLEHSLPLGQSVAQ
jgi:hypothetical protein